MSGTCASSVAPVVRDDAPVVLQIRVAYGGLRIDLPALRQSDFGRAATPAP